MKLRLPFLLALCLPLAAAGDDSTLQGPLIIFNAGSLAAPMADLLREFARRHPRVAPQQESSGSLDAARKLTELGKPCDVLAVADYEVIPGLLVPQHAGWYAVFARNQLVLMYTPRSKYAGEINSRNWFEVLLRPEVEWGHSNPDADPAGYRTLLMWKLAENYYQRPGLYQRLQSRVPARNIRAKSVELVALLEAGELDYIYGYRSVAEQHHLPFISFPAEIDLSDPGKRDLYERVAVEVAGKKPGERVTVRGLPILFALTIPRTAPHSSLAEAFLDFMFSADGQAIMRRNHLAVISPPLASDLGKLPGGLRPRFVAFEEKRSAAR